MSVVELRKIAGETEAISGGNMDRVVVSARGSTSAS